MKKLKYISLALLLVLILPSCQKDYLDINRDPNASDLGNVPPGALFTDRQIGYSQNNLNTLNVNGQTFVQYFKPVVVLRAADTYNFSEISNGNFWENIFGGIKDLKYAEKNAAGFDNTIAQLKVMQALYYLTAVDLYGEIPFTEANNPEILNPKFDEPSVVYNGILDLLDESTDLFTDEEDQLNEPFIMKESDQLFFGDVDKWVRFANSLKLRIIMRLSNVDQEQANVKKRLDKLMSDPNKKFIDDNQYNAEFTYYPNRSNQNFDFATFDKFIDYGSFIYVNGQRRQCAWRLGSSSLVDLMNTYNDPRRSSYFDREYDNKLHETDPDAALAKFLDKSVPFVGSGNGRQQDTPESCTVSMYYIRQDKSDEWFKASEYHLLMAEAYQRGLLSGNADDAIKAAINASMHEFDGFSYLGKDYSIPQADIDAYIASLDLTTDKLKLIQEQQYIALYNVGTEAWANWRRQKVPTLPLPAGVSQTKTIISRMTIPLLESQANKNAPANTFIYTPVYFEKKN